MRRPRQNPFTLTRNTRKTERGAPHPLRFHVYIDFGFLNFGALRSFGILILIGFFEDRTTRREDGLGAGFSRDSLFAGCSCWSGPANAKPAKQIQIDMTVARMASLSVVRPRKCTPLHFEAKML